MNPQLAATFLFLLILLAHTTANSSGQGGNVKPAIVTRKLLHKNGLKEFTVRKNIKGNECACACFCSLPDSPEALAQMHSARPKMDFAPLKTTNRSFEIEKEIRGNQCKCSCACAEPEEQQELGQTGEWPNGVELKGLAPDGAQTQTTLATTSNAADQLDNKVEEEEQGEGAESSNGTAISSPPVQSTMASAAEVPSLLIPEKPIEITGSGKSEEHSTLGRKEASTSPAAAPGSSTEPATEILKSSHFFTSIEPFLTTFGSQPSESPVHPEGTTQSAPEQFEPTNSAGTQSSSNAEQINLETADNKYSIQPSSESIISSSASSKSAESPTEIFSESSTTFSSSSNTFKGVEGTQPSQSAGTERREGSDGFGTTPAMLEQTTEMLPRKFGPEYSTAIEITAEISSSPKPNRAAVSSRQSTANAPLEEKVEEELATKTESSLAASTIQNPISYGTTEAFAPTAENTTLKENSTMEEEALLRTSAGNETGQSTTARKNPMLGAEAEQMLLSSTTPDNGLKETAPSAREASSSTAKPGEEEAFTFDPVFKSRVASLLSKLKNKLFQLRQAEQANAAKAENGTMEGEGGELKKEGGEEKPEEKPKESANRTMLFQIDEEVKNAGKEDKNGNSEKKQKEEKAKMEEKEEEEETSLKGTTPSKLANNSVTSQKVQQNASSSTNQPESAQFSPNTPPTTIESHAFVTADGIEDSAETESERKWPTSQSSAIVSSSMSTSSSSTSPPRTSSSPPAPSTEESTPNPMFKARVANLLNRLKEQLYLLRVAQQKQHKPQWNISLDTESTMDSSSPPANHLSPQNQLKSEQLLVGLQQTLEQLQAKTLETEGFTGPNKKLTDAAPNTTTTTTISTAIPISSLPQLSTISSSTASASRSLTSEKPTERGSPSSTSGRMEIASNPSTPSSSTSTSIFTSSNSPSTSNGPTIPTTPSTAATSPSTSQSPSQVVGQSNNLEGANGTRPTTTEDGIGFAFVTEAPERGGDEFASNVDDSDGLADGGNWPKNGTSSTDEKNSSTAANLILLEAEKQKPSAEASQAPPGAVSPPPALLFPLAKEFFAETAPKKETKEREGKGAEEDEKRSRVILLRAPPKGSPFLTATSRASTFTPEINEAAESSTRNTWAKETGKNGAQVTTAEASQQSRNLHGLGGEDGDLTSIWTSTGRTASLATTLGDTLQPAGSRTTKPEKQQKSARKKLIAPQAQNLIERLEQARKLREEQVKLEMMEAIRQQQLGGSPEPDPKLSQRRREIEQSLLHLAQAERMQREMLERKGERQQQQQGEPASTPPHPPLSPSPPTVSASSPQNSKIDCQPVRRFIRLFHISQPRQWIEQNCQFARRHFPNASCQQIGALLRDCLGEEDEEDEGIDGKEEGEE